MTDQLRLTDNELEFFYFGFYRVLRQYRTKTIIGWCIAAIGIASVPLGWKFGTPHGIIDTALAAATIVAGIAVVHQSVSSLETYVRVPFPVSVKPDGEQEPPLTEILEVIRSVETGGWQEAYRAIGALREIGRRWNLPEVP